MKTGYIDLSIALYAICRHETMLKLVKEERDAGQDAKALAKAQKRTRAYLRRRLRDRVRRQLELFDGVVYVADGQRPDYKLDRHPSKSSHGLTRRQMPPRSRDFNDAKEWSVA